jgi:hypothetical protein
MLGIIERSDAANLAKVQGGAAGEVVAESQQAVLELMRMGKSVAETARTTGMSRSTIYRWLKTDPAFAAAYNQWQDELEQHSRSRLYGMMDLAADALEKALAAGDARMAMQLFKSMAIARPSEPRLLEEEQVRQRMALDRKTTQMELQLENRALDTDDHVSRIFEMEFGDMADQSEKRVGKRKT